MKINFFLNDKKTVFSSDTSKDSSETLLSALRKEKLYSVKCGCQKGLCGNCMVLLDDVAVSSCLIPIGIIKDCKVVTLEYFKNDPFYQYIITGFSKAGISLCGYCNSGKIFSAYMILKKYRHPNSSDIYSAIKDLDSCCTDFETLTKGILFAVEERDNKEGKVSNGKK